MKPKTVILLVVAVGCGLVASYMTSRVIADRSAAPPETVKVAIVYAIKNVPANQVLHNPAEFFEVRQVPEEMVPKGRPIKDLAHLTKKRLVNPVGVDKFVSEDDLLSGNDAGGMPYRVPAGMRAVSVRVSQDMSVGGFVLPGHHVDIMCVPNGSQECNTILQRVQVLAVNALERKPEDKSNLETHMVTFAVSPDDANKLALATFSGSLRFSLRGIDDDKTAHARPAKREDLHRPSHEASDPVLQQADAAGPTAQGQPGVPNVPTNTAPAAESVRREPKLLWVMKGRNGPQVTSQKYFDEEAPSVETSNPEDDAEPAKKSEKPTGKGPADSEDAPAPVKKDSAGKK